MFEADHDLKRGLILSVAFHFMLVITIWIAGTFWHQTRTMPPIYTVRLFEAPRPAPRPIKRKKALIKKPEKKIQAKREKQTAKVTKKTPPKRLISKPKEAPKISKPKKKVVSLAPKPVKKTKKENKPVQKETRKKQIKKKKQTKKVQPSPEQILEKRLKQLQERVKEKQEEKLLKERLLALKAKIERAKKQEEEQGNYGSSQGTLQQDEALRAYCTAIWAAVREHWSFPEQFFDRPGLVCIIVVRIGKDGSLMKVWFEKKSDSALFNQSCMRAVNEAAPFPRPPKNLGPGPIEIGIRFKPGQVGE